MAQYTITHSCGHTQTTQLYGPGKDRERKAEWMAQRVCPDCYQAEQDAKRKAENEAAAAQNAAESLPELLGSPKQVAWAETIRRKALDNAARVRTVNPAALAVATKPELVAMGKEYIEVYESTMAKLRGETSAKWWIENRDTVETILEDACAKVLRKHNAYK
jgi:hypothetical protein